MKIRTTKYLWKLVLLTTLTGALPVILLGGLTYYKSSSIIAGNITESNKQILEKTQLSVEQVLKTIDMSVTQFISSSPVISVLNQSMQGSYENYEQISQLTTGLNHLQIYEQGETGAYLANVSKGWVIDNGGRTFLDEYKARNEILRYMENPKQSYYTKNEKDAGSVLLVKKVPLNSYFNANGVIVVRIQKPKLGEALNEGRRLGDLFILDENQQIISQQNNYFTDGNQTRLSFAEKLREAAAVSGSGFFTAEIGNDRLGIEFRRSEYNGWYYVSVLSNAAVSRQVSPIGWFTFITCIAIFILTLIFAWLGSRRMYNPIRRIYETIVSSVPGEKGTEDDLQLIADGLHGLITSGSEMKGRIQVQLMHVNELFVLKLFHGAISAREIRENGQLFGHTAAWRHMAVLALQIDSLEQTRYKEEDRELLLFAISNMASELIPNQERLIPVAFQGSQLTLLGSDKEDVVAFEESVQHIAESIQAAVDRYLNLRVSIGISRSFPQLVEAEYAFEEALQALKYRLRLGEGVIIHIEDVEPKSSLAVPYPKAMQQELLDAVKLSDFAKAEGLLAQFIGVLRQSEMRPSEYHFMLMQLLSQLIQLVQDAGIPLEEITDGKSMVDRLAAFRTLDDIEAWFKDEVIVPIIRLFDKRRRYQSFEITSEVTRMVHEEYYTDLSLDVCATRLKVHPSYVSRIFRKEKGISFSEYLSDYRLKVAKNWLIETDMKISDIADRLKYKSSANFIRYFRKEAGMTPGQFREQSREQPQEQSREQPQEQSQEQSQEKSQEQAPL